MASRPAGATVARVVMGGAAGVTVAALLQIVTGVGGADLRQLFDDAVYVLVVIVLGACAWRTWVDASRRMVWLAVTVGMLSWTVGYFVQNLLQGGILDSPSPADFFYLGFYPATYVAIVTFRRRYDRRPGSAVWLDGLIAAAACAAIGARLAIEPAMSAVADQPLAAGLITVAYPVGDVMLLAMLVMAIPAVGLRGLRELAPLALGFAVFAVTDAMYLVQIVTGSYVPGGILDLGWLIGAVLIGLAATSVGVRGGRLSALRSRATVPVVAAIVALVAISVEAYGESHLVSMGLAILTLTLVIARMALSLRETATLLEARARDAVTDSLTGLPNRRRLVADLEEAAAEASPSDPLMVALFDLDNFKPYNDTFGHPAGDALLTRIGVALRAAVGSRGDAYRMSGDEFCAVLRPGPEPAERVGLELAAAMTERGEGFEVTASFGCTVAPRDGSDPSVLLRLADDEMYARKGSRRPGTERQIQDTLLAALRERDPHLQEHASGVVGLAAAVGRQLGLGPTDLRMLAHAAALHDIGKIAIPESILGKAAPLADEESRFMHTYPLIGQRIIAAAPALRYVSRLVRSVQERWDGDGYPDGLAGEEIPLAARVVAVCSAYRSITHEPGLPPAASSAQAVVEIRRGAGTRFDPRVVAALVEVVACSQEPSVAAMT